MIGEPVKNSRADRRFWLVFALLNGLLFLPAYLLGDPPARFWPVAGERSLWAAALVWRDNLDIFRLHAEWTVLVAAWVFVPALRRRGLRGALGFLYGLALVYGVYEVVMRTLYQSDPVLYSQALLFRDGVGFVLAALGVPGWALLLLAAAVVGLGLGVRRLVQVVTGDSAEFLTPLSRAVLLLLVLWVAAAGLTQRSRLASPKMAVSSLTAKLQQNLSDSLALYRQVQTFDATSPQAVYNYGDYRLLHRPNIYLIFVESYGSVLYQRDDWRDAYRTTLDTHQAQLSADGWHMATTLSDAPTWGGGSWMSYTSALFGLHIDSQPQFLALLDTYVRQPYPAFGRFLHAQGYRNVHVSSIVADLRPEQWDDYGIFYGVDRWLRFPDLAYSGALYGWGPAPPDQFVLHAARDQLRRESSEPFMMFFITQNSHYPWAPLPSAAADWRALDDGTAAAVVPELDPKSLPLNALRRGYLRAVTYELDVLLDFVRATGDEDALFVLVGDHQPQQVSRRADGYATPVHILSRDPALIAAVERYGFTPGLFLTEPAATLNHEGLYSLLVNLLVGRYGDGVKLPPPFLPAGLGAVAPAAH